MAHLVGVASDSDVDKFSDSSGTASPVRFSTADLDIVAPSMHRVDTASLPMKGRVRSIRKLKSRQIIHTEQCEELRELFGTHTSIRDCPSCTQRELERKERVLPLAPPRYQNEATVDLFGISGEKFSWLVEDQEAMLPHMIASQEALNKIGGNRAIPVKRRRVMVMEVIAKMFTYLRLSSSQRIIIPTIQDDGTTTMESYTPRAVDLGVGNMMYLLKPENKNLPPIFSFRGTVVDDLGSLWASVGPRGLMGLITDSFVDVGSNVVNDKKGMIIEILDALQAEGYSQLPLFTGHSLGGALAQRFLVEDGIYQRVAGGKVYNSPTINYDVCKKWNLLEDEGEVDHIDFEVHNTAGDILADHSLLRMNHLDHYFIGRKFVLDTNRDLGKMEAHSRLVSSCAGTLQEVPRSQAGIKWQSDTGWYITLLPRAVAAAVVALISAAVFAVLELISTTTHRWVGYDLDRKDRIAADAALRAFSMTLSENSNILDEIDLHHKLWWDRDIRLRESCLQVADENLGPAMVDFLLVT